MKTRSANSNVYQPPAQIPENDVARRSSSQGYQPYPLRNRISSIQQAPKNSAPKPSTSPPKNPLNPSAAFATFYDLLALKISKEAHKGALGKKWSIKILNAAEQLKDKPSTAFIRAYNSMDADELAKMFRGKVQRLNRFSIKLNSSLLPETGND